MSLLRTLCSRLRVADDVGVGGGCACLRACVTQARLDARTVVTADEFADTLLLRERSHSTFPYAPTESLETLAPGAFYIEGVDEKNRRTYARKPHDYDDEHDEPIAAAA